MSREKELITRKLHSELSRRSTDIGTAIQHIETTGEMMDDYIVPSRHLSFENNGSVSMGFSDNRIGLHRNAVKQLSKRFGINVADSQREVAGDDWERQAFIDRMNTYKTNAPEKNLLVRKVGGEAKAVLSDRYRRLNTAAIFLSFMQAAQATGSVLVDANHGDLKDYLEVIHPEVVEIPTEKNGMIYTAFGAQIRNSDFGASKLELRMYQMNIVCLNGMVSKSMISDVHLGSQIDQSDNVLFTAETMDADTNARALAVRDIMNSIYSVENLTRERQRIVDASAIELDYTQEIKKLPKMGLLQGEADAVAKTLMNNNPDDGVQGANTLWKLAQGMTSVANKTEDKDRKRELQDVASSMIAEYVDN